MMTAKKRSKSAKAGALVPQPGSVPVFPAGYDDLLADIKNRIAQARVRATLSVNRELIQLYWQIGRLIVERQQVEGWGRSVVERLAGGVPRRGRLFAPELLVHAILLPGLDR